MGVKYILSVILWCSCLLPVRAQSSAFTEKFNAYQAVWPKVNLHLIFNQDKYAPGDTAWFKAYFLTEDLIGVSGKQLIDMNLVDGQGASLLHLIFTVNDGVGNNQLIIPDTLAPGVYLVTAHSRWMKNFDAAYIFKKEIKVVSNNEIETKPNSTLRVATEGGHLIRETKNKISIQSQPGKIVQIMDATGQEIARATADQHGMSSVVFTPTQNTSYSARVTGEVFSTPLPVVEDGCSMQLIYNNDEEHVTITLASPRGSAWQQDDLVLIVSSRGKIHHTATARLGTYDSTKLQLPLTGLQGLAHLSVLTQAGTLLASRDFYCAGKDSMKATLTTGKSMYQTREKVRLEISITDARKPVEGEFSIRVNNAALFDNFAQTEWRDELLLTGIRDNFSIDRSKENWKHSLDNFLILNTEPLTWKKILAQDSKRPEYPFSQVLERSGRVFFPDTGEPVPDLTQVLFYLQRSKLRFQTFTLEAGWVGFALPDIFGEDEFFYLARVGKDGDLFTPKITWDEAPVAQPRGPDFNTTERTDRYAEFVKHKNLIDQSFGLHSPTADVIPANTALSDFEDEFGEADVTVNVQDFVLFPTMEELVKEIIPSVYHRKTAKKTTVRVSVPQPMMATGDPLYVIDDIATRNTTFFLSLNPADILTIKVIISPSKLLPLGMLGKNGIVIVQTKSGTTRMPVDKSNVITGLTQALDFKAHTPVSQPSQPDFRSTIFWSPSVKTDVNGKAVVEFYSSDDVGALRILLQGLTKSGKPLSEKQSLTISGRKN